MSAYYAIDPWGGLRTDIPVAQLCSMLTHMFSKKGLGVDAFMPFVPKQRPTEKQVEAKLMAIARMFGAGVPK